jgi:hypothetical protein
VLVEVRRIDEQDIDFIWEFIFAAPRRKSFCECDVVALHKLPSLILLTIAERFNVHTYAPCAATLRNALEDKRAFAITHAQFDNHSGFNAERFVKQPRQMIADVGPLSGAT